MSSGNEFETVASEVEFERLLLESARDDELPSFEPALERFHVALNLAALGVAANAAKPAIAAARRLALRWTLIGAALGSGATALVFVLARSAEPAHVSEATARPSAAVTVMAPASQPGPVPAISAAALSSAHPTEPAARAPLGKRRATRALPSASAPTDSTLIAEVALLDSVRELLRRGEGEPAMRLLSSYQQRFPNGQLSRDATALSIEALALQGDRGELERRAATFLENSPDDPQAARVRSLQQR
jgi:hypothetical protein